MPRAIAVIGANFGDEGKGLITDYLADQEKSTLCVRFNGGAQAGHTVVAPNGTRHIFHHLGAGSFAGAYTYLSKFFICNPVMFVRECEELMSKGLQVPKVFCDPDAIISTPFDMQINQALEKLRGGNRHGSCGMGINETIERSGRYGPSPFRITMRDMAKADDCITKLVDGIVKYTPKRCKELGLTGTVLKDLDMDMDIGKWITVFAEARVQFLEHVACADAKEILSSEHSVIFEGAQGLLLDQTYGIPPHVTPSNTGNKNVISLCNEWGIKELRAFYVTRTYLTRHGAGPLNGECIPAVPLQDYTNQPNDFQGALRYAPLDVRALRHRLWWEIDSAAAMYTGRITHELAVTHLDQHRAPPGLLEPYTLCAWGPARGDVRRIEPWEIEDYAEQETASA